MTRSRIYTGQVDKYMYFVTVGQYAAKKIVEHV